MSLDISFNFHNASLQDLELAGVPHDIRLYRVLIGVKRLHSVVNQLSHGTISLYQDLENRHVDQLVFSYRLGRTVFDNGDLIDLINDDYQFKQFFDTMQAIKDHNLQVTITASF